MNLYPLFDHLSEGEHRSEALRVSVESELADKTVRLAFLSPGGVPYLSEAITLADGSADYYLPAELTDRPGKLFAQLEIYDGDEFIKKSCLYDFDVFPSADTHGDTLCADGGLITLGMVYDRLLSHDHDERYIPRGEMEEDYYTAEECDSRFADAALFNEATLRTIEGKANILCIGGEDGAVNADLLPVLEDPSRGTVVLRREDGVFCPVAACREEEDGYSLLFAGLTQDGDKTKLRECVYFVSSAEEDGQEEPTGPETSYTELFTPQSLTAGDGISIVNGTVGVSSIPLSGMNAQVQRLLSRADSAVQPGDLSDGSVTVAKSCLTADVQRGIDRGDSAVQPAALAAYQPKLTAGSGIDITDNVISAEGGGGVTREDLAGGNVTVAKNCLTADVRRAIDRGDSAVQPAALAAYQPKLTAGSGIDITDNVISAEGAGDFVISCTAGNFTASGTGRYYAETSQTDKTFSETDSAYAAGKSLRCAVTFPDGTVYVLPLTDHLPAGEGYGEVFHFGAMIGTDEYLITYVGDEEDAVSPHTGGGELSPVWNYPHAGRVNELVQTVQDSLTADRQIPSAKAVHTALSGVLRTSDLQQSVDSGTASLPVTTGAVRAKLGEKEDKTVYVGGTLSQDMQTLTLTKTGAQIKALLDEDKTVVINLAAGPGITIPLTCMLNYESPIFYGFANLGAGIAPVLAVGQCNSDSTTMNAFYFDVINPANTVTGVNTAYKVQAVSALPASPNADTLYLVTGA